MRFADPYFFALLALVPLLLLLRARWQREGAIAPFSSLSLLAGYRPTWRIRYRWLPTAARAAALALLVVALARPQVGQAESELPGRGIDIALVLDTSGSMATDFGGDSRLAVAQRVVSNFIEEREEDRIGLVIFQEIGLVLSPLTLDYDALTRLVQDVGRIDLRDGTAIGIGLSNAVNLLRESNARSRVVVLLTDGENNSGSIEPAAAARIAETLGIRLYTIGLVDSRARIAGQVNVDEQALREMAQLTGGRYFAAENEQSLAEIYSSIDSLEKSRVGRPQFGAYDELAVYFLAGALLLLALDLLLRVTVWRRTA